MSKNEEILNFLLKMNGEVSKKDIVNGANVEPTSAGVFLYTLKKKGLIRKGTKYGYYSLTEQGKAYANSVNYASEKSDDIKDEKNQKENTFDALDNDSINKILIIKENLNYLTEKYGRNRKMMDKINKLIF